jgi:hypothetical protein
MNSPKENPTKFPVFKGLVVLAMLKPKPYLPTTAALAPNDTTAGGADTRLVVSAIPRSGTFPLVFIPADPLQ